MEGNDRHVHLALNHRLASVFFDGQYAKLWMQERLLLHSDLAMLVHAFLSTCIRPGHHLNIGIATLAERVWPQAHKTAPEGTRRRRSIELRQALLAIGRLGHWSVSLDAKRDVGAVHRMETQTGQGRIKPISSPATQDVTPGNVSGLFAA